MTRSLLGILIVCVTLPFAAAAQPATPARISGVVLDADTGRPLYGAHVFLAETTIGTATDRDGRFELRPVPAGAQRLYVSMVGFQNDAVDTLVHPGHDYVVTVRLEPRVVELTGVDVEAERDRRWRRRLRRFERHFVGKTEHAERTTLINPEVLGLDGGWGRLTAEAQEPLVIENRALGYRLHYHLEEFEKAGGLVRYDGEPVFQELEPADSAEAASWRAARQRAFEGSLRHFLQALVAGRTQEENFSVYRRWDLEAGSPRWRQDPGEIIRADSAGTWVLDVPRYLEVLYTAENESRDFLWWHGRSSHTAPGPQRSWIRLTDGPTHVDGHGEPLDPYGLTVYGYFAFESVAAEMLPRKYGTTRRTAASRQ